MKVRNVPGTGERECNCDSWIDHWERFSGEKTNFCLASDCLAEATDGAHVVKVNSNDKSQYIVPLCHACNMRTDNFDVPGEDLVPANVNKTCG